MFQHILRTLMLLAAAGKWEIMLEFMAFIRDLWVVARDQALLDKIYDKAQEIIAKEDAAMNQ